MKINTKLFNEDFIEVANNIPKMQNQRNTTASTKFRARSEQRSICKKSKFSKSSGTQSMDPDEEDRRLDRLQKMRN